MEEFIKKIKLEESKSDENRKKMFFFLKKGRKEEFLFSRCIGGINRKLRKIIIIPLIEVCRWHLRSLWKVP